MASDELESFLEEHEQEKHVHDEHGSTSKRRRFPLTATLVATNIALLIACVFLATRLSSISNGDASNSSIRDPYSPANSIIEYEQRKMIFNDTRFTGYPSDKWEVFMHELLEGTLLRVSDSELQHQGFDSIPLEDGGYAAGLGVAHNLHCVKKIKMFLYRDYFYSDLDPEGAEFAHTQEHADHCLDWIRQSMMCHVDYAMYTLQWEEDGPRKGKLKHNEPGLQKCVNFDKLHDWMKGRSANSNMLQHPGDVGV
ncbi:hypothetical protein PRZ48_002749 [Zasmidium cellare]|uniref:Tat pathway signal sequence n=1 Tax=Zasmidium cellare TaxID=395010 RepID=A0ABR0ETG1_ZASCE|nr:hypothetical protein PRZ48_002749 [Zasmidium cellare]